MATATQSLAHLFGIPEQELRKSLIELTVDWHADVSPEEQVLHHLGYTDRVLPPPSGIRWFHASRVLPGTTFEEGILPTTGRLPQLWNALKEFAREWLSEDQWRQYQLDFANSDRQFAAQFRRKEQFLGPGMWEGPFAFLVRDAAVGAVGDHIDFTAMPECLEDICGDFEEVFGKPLGAAFRQATRPCLVVFTRPGDWPGAVRAAASYVYRSLQGLDHDRACNTCFDGEGEAVPLSWIDAVEWIGGTVGSADASRSAGHDGSKASDPPQP